MPAIVTLLNPARGKARIRGNPHLVIVNGRKGNKTMATAKQKKARALFAKRAKSGYFKKGHHKAAASVKSNRGRGGLFKLNKRNGKTTVFNRRRHHNPGMFSIFEGAITAILGMAITDFVQNTLIASFLPDLSSTPVMKGGVRIALAAGVGMVADKFGFKKQANLLAIGGSVGGAQDILRGFIGGGGLLFPAPAPMPALPPGKAMIPVDMTGDDAGTNDIVYVDPAFNQLGGFNDIVYHDFPQHWFS